MYEREKWTIKKAERRRSDACELWCWRRLLRAPWLQRDQASPSESRWVLDVHWKHWYWRWNSTKLDIWWKELTHLKRPWCWEKLKTGKEGDNTGWDGRMVPPTQRILDTLNSETTYWIWKPGKLQYMGLQREEYELPTELKWTNFPPGGGWLLLSFSVCDVCLFARPS